MRRTQGDWSPDDPASVQFAAAGVKYTGPEYYLLAVNDLYGAGGDEFIEKMLDRGHRMFLDSGIFNLTNEHMRAVGCTMDEALALAPTEITGFDRLFDRYIELVSRWGDRLWGYIELDQGGAANKRITRARLHDLGLDPIPVYHPLNDGWDYFDELASSYERICIGNIVQADYATRVRILHTIWERRRAYPELRWIHALGLTPNETCLPFPPESSDSSSWVNGMRYPAVQLGTSALKRITRIYDPGFRYSEAANPSNQGEAAPEAADRHERLETACSYAAIGVYADEVEFSTVQWRRIAADRAAELGETSLPPYLPGEAALCPA